MVILLNFRLGKENINKRSSKDTCGSSGVATEIPSYDDTSIHCECHKYYPFGVESKRQSIRRFICNLPKPFSGHNQICRRSCLCQIQISFCFFLHLSANLLWQKTEGLPTINSTKLLFSFEFHFKVRAVVFHSEFNIIINAFVSKQRKYCNDLFTCF